MYYEVIYENGKNDVFSDREFENRKVLEHYLRLQGLNPVSIEPKVSKSVLTDILEGVSVRGLFLKESFEVSDSFGHLNNNRYSLYIYAGSFDPNNCPEKGAQYERYTVYLEDKKYGSKQEFEFDDRSDAYSKYRSLKESHILNKVA